MTDPHAADEPPQAPASWHYVHDDGDNRDLSVTVPRESRDIPPRSWCPDMTVDANVMAQLLVDSRGEEVSVERYRREFECLVPGHPWQLQRLHEYGLLISPDEALRRTLAFDALIYGPEDEQLGGATSWETLLTRPKVRAKRPLPDPFPAYGNGQWAGTRESLLDTPHPGAATSVVYHLFDAAAARIYIGSTSNLCNRFNGHIRKPWVHYEARECASREDAYWLEAAAIIEYRPPLNDHDYVGGRINALIAAVGAR